MPAVDAILDDTLGFAEPPDAEWRDAEGQGEAVKTTCNPDFGFVIEEGEDEAWAVLPDAKERLKEVMSAPLLRAIDAWNNRIDKGPLPPGREQEELDDRIREEIWLLRIHGYSGSAHIQPDGRHEAENVYTGGVILPAKYGYCVCSLEDLSDPHRPWSLHTFPATGGFQPGEFERARDVAEALGGIVMRNRIRRFKEYDANNFYVDRFPGHDECVFVSEKLTPVAAYETFIQRYRDNIVFSKFLAVFEHMRLREHRNAEAINERKLTDYQRLGEIAFYLSEMRSWKADQDWLISQDKY